VFIIGHNVFVWVAPRCVWSSLDTSWLSNWIAKEKRNKQYPLTIYILQLTIDSWGWRSQILLSKHKGFAFKFGDS
jgi:hypothetical protein